MRKARIFLILGVWVAILPYLGFPQSWKSILFSLSGLFLAYIGYIMHQEEKIAGGDQDFDNFKENKTMKPGVVRHPVRSVEDAGIASVNPEMSEPANQNETTNG